MKVGVILRMTEDESGIPSYRDLAAVAREAEAGGLSSVWVCDHMMFRFPASDPKGTWEAVAVLAGIAEATDAVDIGSLVMCTAFRNPLLLAKTAATLDEISDGRLILGLGAGWHGPELHAAGLPTGALVSRFEEALRIITALLRDGTADFRGTYYRASEFTLRPRGPRDGEIPIIVGGEGPRVVRLATRYADAWNTAWHETLERVDERREVLARTCRDVGRVESSLGFTIGLAVKYDASEDPAADGRLREVLGGLRERGAEHVICDVNPFDRDAVAWLASVATPLVSPVSPSGEP
jgi:alkanesulfonate monooxygenase SsuD/methylene tetrahydromethanopterin reductase-like flavin-dependent oxidoreductase (luciferase family)